MHEGGKERKPLYQGSQKWASRRREKKSYLVCHDQKGGASGREGGLFKSKASTWEERGVGSTKYPRHEMGKRRADEFLARHPPQKKKDCSD